MRLVIGGAHQGKLQWVLDQTREAVVLDGASCPIDSGQKADILNRLHLLVRRLLEQGEEPWRFVEELLCKNPGIIIICDELGCGIVPLQAFDRRWREETGRICCALARRAKRVDRVFCGIGSPIKEEL